MQVAQNKLRKTFVLPIGLGRFNLHWKEKTYSMSERYGSCRPGRMAWVEEKSCGWFLLLHARHLLRVLRDFQFVVPASSLNAARVSSSVRPQSSISTREGEER